MNKRYAVAAVTLLLITGVYSVMAQEKDAQAERIASLLTKRSPDLAQKWEDFQRGKRPPIDGYIIISRLRDELLLAGKGETQEFRDVDARWQQLLIKNPLFRSRPPEKLSDETQARSLSPQEDRKLLELKVARFIPRDDRIIDVHSGMQGAVLEYQYRLDFVTLPPGAKALQRAQDKEYELIEIRDDGEHPIDRTQLTIRKTLSFQRRFRIKTSPENLLACSYLLMGYTGNSVEEKRITRFKGHSRYLPWKNEQGQYADFCGVVNFKGDVIYQFPFAQKVPNKLLDPLKISSDGKSAAVMVGEKVTYMEGEDGFSVGYPSEILIWEFPNRFKKVRATEASAELQSLAGVQFWEKRKRSK